MLTWRRRRVIGWLCVVVLSRILLLWLAWDHVGGGLSDIVVASSIAIATATEQAEQEQQANDNSHRDHNLQMAINPVLGIVTKITAITRASLAHAA